MPLAEITISVVFSVIGADIMNPSRTMSIGGPVDAISDGGACALPGACHNPPMPVSNTPTMDEVDRIAALEDPVIRNLRITQCYHTLANALAPRLARQANWCVFATWASRQAGQSIRKEDFARALGRALATSAPGQRAIEGVEADTTADRSLLLALYAAGAVERASAAVARGNLKVFAEIGREFARFLTTCGDDAGGNPGRIAAFRAGLRDGDPPDGQRYLRSAFSHYHQALFTSDSKQRSELIFEANSEIGFHEQTRLQPEITAALEAGFLIPGSAPRDLLGSLDALQASLRARIRAALTAHMMTLWIPPGAPLRLGEDVPAGFPVDLERIDTPELRDFLARIDPTSDNVRDSGAIDWSDLSERLHFIVDFFRRYQAVPELWTPPFTPEQVAAINQGRLPQGDL